MNLHYRKDGNAPLKKFSPKQEKGYQGDKAKREKENKPPRGEKKC